MHGLLAIPTVSRGFAALTPAAVAAARAFADAAARAVSAQLGLPCTIAGRPLPAVPARAVGAVRLAIALEASAATALLELDAAFGSAVLSHVAGARDASAHGLGALPVERSLLELLALVALDGAAGTRVDALLPRLVVEGTTAAGPADASALAVGLELSLAERRYRGRLLLDAAAVRALASPPEVAPEAAALLIDASLRGGEASITLDELSSLGPGDVVFADALEAALVLPGGLSVRGWLEDALFHVEEIRMTETQAAYPITVAVELGRATITFGELAALAPGVALPLDLRRDGHVVLRAGERALARGQLVEVDGALGIRILQLGDAP
ncbi:MAG: FliM/FliN family flagellar motor switch protein [Anaeromyxobacteraceae bacterium]